MKLAQMRRPPKPLVGDIRSDGLRVGLSVAFHPAVKGWIREHAQAWWCGPSRMWVFVSEEEAHRAVEALGNIRVDRYAFDAKDVWERLRLAIIAPEPDAFVPTLDVQIYSVTGGGYVVRTRFDHRMHAVLQAMGGQRLSRGEGWLVKSTLEHLLDVLQTQAGVERSHLYLHEGEAWIDTSSGGGGGNDMRPRLSMPGDEPEPSGERTKRPEPEEDESSIGGALALALEPLRRIEIDEAWFAQATAPYGLMPHQPAGVRHLMSATSALLADDMGLGKTRQAVVAAHLMSGEGPVLVVCPANLAINWQREVHAVVPGAHVQILGREALKAAAGWVISSYERLGAVVQLLAEKALAPRAVFFDEAHSVVQPAATRTRNAFVVAQKVPNRYLLTATPILNREVELHTLLKLSGHPLGTLERREFVRTFGGDGEARAALAERVAEWMLRRPKAAVRLPGKYETLRHLEMSHEIAAQYAAMGKSQQTGLVKLMRCRQMLERAKADWLIETIKNLAPDDNAIIFCEFEPTVGYFAEEFAKAGIGAVTYQGTQTRTQKQRSIDALQRDEHVRVFIGTTRAAGVGITLTAANYVFFASLPWTAALKRQAEDRAFRIGQKRVVMVVTPVFVNTVDEQVLALIGYKGNIEQDILRDPLAPAANDDDAAAESAAMAKIATAMGR